MKEIKCESGNTYGLALGPAILLSLQEGYTEIISDEVLEKVDKYAEAHGRTSSDILRDEEILENLIGSKDLMVLLKNQQTHQFNTLKKVLRIVNEVRFDNNEKLVLFLEEDMEPKDYPEVMNEINSAVFEFKFGVSSSEKSELLSMVEEKKEALA